MARGATPTRSGTRSQTCPHAHKVTALMARMATVPKIPAIPKFKTKKDADIKTMLIENATHRKGLPLTADFTTAAQSMVT